MYAAANLFGDSHAGVLRVKNRDGEGVNVEPVGNTTVTWPGGSTIPV